MTCFTTPPPPPKCPHQRPPRTPCPPSDPMGKPPGHSTPSGLPCLRLTTVRTKTLGTTTRRRGRWWWRTHGITPQSLVSLLLWEPRYCSSMCWLLQPSTTARTSGDRTPATGSQALSGRPPPTTLVTTRPKRRSCHCR